MKNIILLMSLAVAMLVAGACSDDDDLNRSAEDDLVGLWEQYPAGSSQMTYILLNNDGTGNQWVLDDDMRLQDERPLEWSANKQYVTMTFDNIGSFKVKYEKYGDVLTLSTGETYRKL